MSLIYSPDIRDHPVSDLFQIFWVPFKPFSQEELDKVYTPVGLDVGNERPEEIAISIMAEILMVKNGKGRPANV